jgi:hypothetical protein
MKDRVQETRDFKCRVCGTRWLDYAESNIPCSISLYEYQIHNFDFSKPIKLEPKEILISTPEVQVGKITFQ